MKKFVSVALAVLMTLTVFGALLPTAAAASTGEVVLYEENFDSLGSVTNETLFNALGWKDGAKTGLSLVSGVSGKALKIEANQTVGGADTLYVLLENEKIANGVKVQYDFKFDSSSSAVSQSSLTRGFHWYGNGTLTRENSWNVSFQLNNTYLNQYRKSSGGWGSGAAWSQPWTAGSTTDTWYTMEYELDPSAGVTMKIKPQGAANWAYTHTWSTTTYNNSLTETTSCFEKYIGLQVNSGVIVMLDNLKVSYDESFPQFVSYQTQTESDDTFSLRLISVLKDLNCQEVGYKVKMSLRENNVVKSVEKSVACNYAYETIDGKSANQLSGAISSAEYIYVLTITGIPATPEIEYTVTPFMVVGGETIYGRSQTITYAHNDWQGEVPQYTTSGTVGTAVEVTDRIWRKLITGTSRAEYDSYRNTLVSKGYTLYAENTINSNHYATYKNEGSMVHVYYEAQKNRARVIYAPIGVMVDYDLLPVSDGTNVATPALTLFSLDYTTSNQLTGNNGMGFVYTMSDGSYVIIDGGWGADTDSLYQFLRNNNKRADGKILIRAWLISHYHEDHYGNFENFATKYADKVTLENFVANFDASASALQPSDLKRVETALAKFTGKQDTKYVVPQAGQKMYFGEAQFEFLHTQELLYPDCASRNGNNLSLVAKITFMGKTMLMTADAYPGTGHIPLENMYGSYLKSDYVQTPHHGYEVTGDSFYDLVDAEFAFVTTSDEECERRVSLGASNANYAGLHHLIAELKTPYAAASGEHHTIYYAKTVLQVGDYATQKDTVVFGDYFQ